MQIRLTQSWLYFWGVIQGGPIKMEQHTSHNMWMQWLLSVDEVSSEDNTKISNFGSVVCCAWHILWDNVEVQHFSFYQAKTRREWMSFQLSIVVSSSPINFINVKSINLKMRIDKWIFLRRKIPHTLIPVIASIYYGKYAILFLLGHPV